MVNQRNLISKFLLAFCCLVSVRLFSAEPACAANRSAAGPLRIHPTNPRYFTDGTTTQDGTFEAVYLTGSHTWANLIDRGPGDVPPVFDFNGYLDLLQKHGHNFIRLWARHVSWYHGYGDGELHAAPLAWLRTGPGTALDGKPRFNLTQLDAGYFERLRERVIAARDRRIYVSIMLFGGQYECHGGWRGNPFNLRNNINGIDGDPSGDGVGPEAHSLKIPAIIKIQETYVRRVIESVNDLDNVLYEIANEADESSIEWQHHFIRFIRDFESKLPEQHPVGMTALFTESASKGNQALDRSPSDWVSHQFDAVTVRSNLPAANGAKVSVLDSDHWFVKDIYKQPQFGREWVWKAFTRGHLPILMEHLPPLSFVDREYPLTIDDAGYVASRRAMGHTRRFAERMQLAAMTPQPRLASTGYCLANSGLEYLVYQPRSAEPFSLELSPGRYTYEWFNPATGQTDRSGKLESAGTQIFEAPFTSDAVLYFRKDA